VNTAADLRSGTWPATSLPYGEDHQIFRDSARRFFETECVPHREAWDDAGMAPREIWKRAGDLGFLGPRIGEAFGGSGGDLLHGVAAVEEQVRAGVIAPLLWVHNDIVAPYVVQYGTPEQKLAILPKMACGELVGAAALTEPGTDGDPLAIRTQARCESGDYVISGRKTFVANGATADLVVVSARTASGISLFVVPTEGLAGFSRGPLLDKLGQRSADTADLLFDEVRLPVASLLGGQEGQGLTQVNERLVEEQLMMGVGAVALMEAAIEHTVVYTRERKAFGHRIIDFQNSRFRLAEARTEAAVCRVFLERCITRFMQGRLGFSEAAMLKWWSTEKQCQIVDQCLQLHGGYGYMLEFPISRMWLDGRGARIWGGANEITKDTIGRAL